MREIYLKAEDWVSAVEVQRKLVARIEGREKKEKEKRMLGQYIYKSGARYFNNDNYEDLVFTSAYWPGAGADGQRGKSWILFGSKFLENYYTVNKSYNDITEFSGQFQGDEMAYAGAGDINGDNIDDLILTCGKYPDQFNTGITYINYGPIPKGNDYSVDDYPNQTKIMPGTTSSYIDAKLGQSIATYDINNDGILNILDIIAIINIILDDIK